MVFDVESIGLHGEGYAFGYVVINGDGVEVECGRWACDPKVASGYESNLKWVQENVPPIEINEPTPEYVRYRFWEAWTKWREKGAVLAADCGWPVEGNFLEACIQWDEMERQFQGPYPFLEISSVMIAKGIDPMMDHERLENELPKHDPLCDARQSARLLWEALQK